MYRWFGLLLIPFLASASPAHAFSPEPEGKVHIRRLSIDSQSLSDKDRGEIIHRLQGGTYPQSEIGVRIQLALHDLGYFKAVVKEPRVSLTMREGKPAADVAVKVDEGICYRLGEIEFTSVTLFPASQMRGLFPMRKGDRFDNSAASGGLEELRRLYTTVGYADFAAVPQVLIDESSRTISLVIDLTEGKPYDFGYLALDGPEPYPGAFKVLVESWKNLQGKRFNPIELRRWLQVNGLKWNSDGCASESTETARDPESMTVNVKLSLPLPQLD